MLTATIAVKLHAQPLVRETVTLDVKIPVIKVAKTPVIMAVKGHVKMAVEAVVD